MRSEVFMREDVAAILRGVNSAQWDLAQHMPQPEVIIFRAGFVSALRALATALHIDLVPDEPESRPVLSMRVEERPSPPADPDLLLVGRQFRVIGNPFWSEDGPSAPDTSQPGCG